MYSHTLQEHTHRKYLMLRAFPVYREMDIIVTAQMTLCVVTLRKYRLLNANGSLLVVILLKEEEKRVKDRSFLEKRYRKCLVSADNLIAWSSLYRCFRPNEK